jgi:hypothetical protein
VGVSDGRGRANIDVFLRRPTHKYGRDAVSDAVAMQLEINVGIGMNVNIATWGTRGFLFEKFGLMLM